jgi:hypothetical protein
MRVLMARDVFISYGKAEKAIADAVCAELESVHHVRCWIAPRDIPAGDSWAQASIEALARAKVIVPIFRSDEPASVEVDAEVQRALRQGLNVVPLRVEVSAQDLAPVTSASGAAPRLDVSSASLRARISRVAGRVCALLEKPVGGAAGAAATVADGTPIPSLPTRERYTAADAPAAPARPAWMVPALIGAGLLVVAILFGLRLGGDEMSGSSDAADAQVETAPAVASTPSVANDVPTTPVVQESASPDGPVAEAQVEAGGGATFAAAPAAAPQAERPVVPPEAAAVVERRPVEPVTGATTPTPVGGAPDAAAASSPSRQQAEPIASTLPPGTLLIDFVNSLPGGSIEVEVDGKVRWSEQFTLRPGGVFARLGLQRVSEQLSSKIEVAPGEHQITVTVLTVEGEVRDYGSTTVRVPSARPVTLRITFSRFRNKLELESAVG